MLRITSSKVVSNAVRAISCRGSRLSGSITNAFKCCSVEDFMAISRHFCTAHDPNINQNSIAPFVISPSDIVPLAISRPTDEAKKEINGNLLEIFDSEIKLKQTSQDTNDMPGIGIPDDFPFTIEDNPWESNITLSRVFHGEKIDVHVYMPYIPQDFKSCSDSDTDQSSDSDDDDSDFSSSADDSDDDDSDDEKKKKKNKTIPLKLKMKVSKEDGKLSEIRFSVSPEEIDMDWVDLQQESAGESTQELLTYFLGKKNTAFVEFLKIRGIDTNIYGFLYEYMVNKKKKIPVAKLEKLREFFAK